ncbi:DNA binding protein [Gynuella sunshinyii]|uniref:MvaT DNA-binding domain-containing protein n=1 Tax=Gynuella sunshinyii YC6258 TaxID=1445510 RepID=A0A0C5W0G8_9GAMM|nr:DNA binding protein [Gynuella sunshinyii]AJQ96184.1 hypothetical Protein YC6258_04148 [Gynuella sunshinyii YC6258]
MIDVDYDKQIQELKKNIEELERRKQEALKREEGFNAFDEALQRIFDEYGLTEYDLFLLKSVDICKWLEKLAGEAIQPGSFHEIKEMMGKLYARENGLVSGKRKSAKVGKKAVVVKKEQPKLEIGIYTNPHTQQTVEKKRRNPKELDAWLDEYGYDTVVAWKQD